VGPIWDGGYDIGEKGLPQGLHSEVRSWAFWRLLAVTVRTPSRGRTWGLWRIFDSATCEALIWMIPSGNLT